jgi:serine/threonine-protein kinase HipA
VLAHNRDDHGRNFAFLMDEKGVWSLAPAYDLTFSEGPGGEHTTMVAGEGKRPTRSHLEELGVRLEIKRASSVIDRVERAVRRFGTFAEKAGVPARLRSAIAKALC